METSAVSSSSSVQAAQSLRQKPEAETAAKVQSTQEPVKTELSASQTAQEAKPAINTSGQTTGTTINTTA